jgi:hypothetical protein
MKCNYKLNDNEVLGLIILGIVIFFIFILPIIDNKNIQCTNKLKEKLSNIKNSKKLDTNICSKQCCNHTQWPIPSDAMTKEISDKEMEKYVGSNLSCNFGSGSGCLCVTKDDMNYLSNRGLNAGKDSCGI